MGDTTVTSGPLTPATSPRPQRAAPLRWWESVSFTAAYALTSALAGLSLSGLYRFGRVFGTLEWLINYKRRRRFRQALEQVTGGAAPPVRRRRAARAFFQQTRCDKLFYLIFDRVPPETARGLFSIDNKALLDESLAKGRGVYIALSHHGPHHVAALLMVRLGYKVAGVRDRRESAIRRFVQSRLERIDPAFRHLRMLFADAYPRDVYRCFHEGYVLGSAMDVIRRRLPHQKREAVTVFGQRREFLTGPLRVAIRCGAPVVQGFIVPEREFQYRLQIVGTLVDPAMVDDEEAAVSRALRRYAENVEHYVQARPELISRV